MSVPFNSALITQHLRFEEERGQVILRHTELTAYRCFLPDLAGFTGFSCTGPSPYPQLVLSYECEAVFRFFIL